ncbi:MAG: hypothetical protein IPJ97_09590 [Proteobacteria bacterium]|nr:hypothetical protein [Pseudomonadota bacterium]
MMTPTLRLGTVTANDCITADDGIGALHLGTVAADDGITAGETPTTPGGPNDPTAEARHASPGKVAADNGVAASDDTGTLGLGTVTANDRVTADDGIGASRSRRRHAPPVMTPGRFALARSPPTIASPPTMASARFTLERSPPTIASPPTMASARFTLERSPPKWLA